MTLCSFCERWLNGVYIQSYGEHLISNHFSGFSNNNHHCKHWLWQKVLKQGYIDVLITFLSIYCIIKRRKIKFQQGKLHGVSDESQGPVYAEMQHSKETGFKMGDNIAYGPIKWLHCIVHMGRTYKVCDGVACLGCGVQTHYVQLFNYTVPV